MRIHVARQPPIPPPAEARGGGPGDALPVIRGEHVSVTALMGAGVDPHLYKASAGDVAALSGAEVIFYNRLHLEVAMGGVLGQMDARTSTVAVASQLPVDQLISPPEYEGRYDPHVWLTCRCGLPPLSASATA